MKSSPILALVCWVGAGVIGLQLWQSGLTGGPDAETKAVPKDVQTVVAVEPPAREDVPVPDGKVSAPVRTIRMKVTAYCICSICCEGWSKYAKTATGDDARIYDGVAADPKLLPYRTRLEIPGIGIKEVDDTGGGMRKSAREGITHIDVRMPSHRQARQWGVRWLEIKILK